ncbi:aldehyde ferredoxin oxidoreductase C-terminal domain-containing protein [Thermocatellispora tengchongensis]|uniref:aldehyde ferredoxin oxidoreductase C-terminal domain-containing protein n=1 Tax=Thermocatellispora tengchongensis TaxID=1073253 RepID=UPI00362CF45A
MLGAKNLKAVVCVPGPGGDGPVPGADPVTLARLAAAYREAIPGNPLASWQHAEPGFAAWVSDGLAPGYGSVRNFSVTGEPGLRLPVAESYAGRALATAGNCPGCPTDCLKVYAPPTTRERRSGGLGQEAFLALGWNLGIDDLDAILDANALANDLGLDQVSLGGTLAFAMECAERGLLPAGAPAFGEPTALPALIHDIAHRSGPYGALLAEGSARAARAIGEEAAPYAMVAKDCELPGFDPRIQPGIGLGYAAAPGGPRYDALEHDLDFDPEEGLPYCLPEAARVGAHPAPVLTLDADRGRRTARLLRLWSALDALNICLFASTPTRPLTIDDILTLVEAASGTPMTLPGLLEAGQTRLDLMHAYALREGVTAESLPSRFHDTPVETGPYQGARLDRKSWSEALTAFKTELGW